MTAMPDAPRATTVQGRLRGAAERVRARASQIARAYRASLSPRTEAEARMVAAQLTMIQTSTHQYALLMPLIGLVIIVYYAGSVPMGRLLVWWVPTTALFLLAGFVGRLQKTPLVERPLAEVGVEAKAFTIISALITITWCAMMPMLWMPADTLNHMILALIVASSMASSSSISAPHLASGRLSIAIYTLALCATPAIVGGHVSAFLVVMGLAFSLSMALNLRSNHAMTARMLSLQEERSGLIDDLKNAKVDSDQARFRAEQASRAKSQFLANMSHELRTPLNAILGFSEMIGSGLVASQPEKSAQYARFVHDSGHHLLALINDILDLAKIEAGGLVLSESEIDLVLLIEECARLMAPKADEGGVALRYELPHDLGPVFADGRALRQVLLNLLSNALKFTPPGGDVVAFAFVERDGTLALGVRDTGVGIADDDQIQVFEKFGQGRHDIVTDEKGTGLGLPIVRGLIEAHGGAVTLASRAGEGTCVTAWLPADRGRGSAIKTAS